MNQLMMLAWRSIWRNRRRTIITTASITLALALAVFFIAFAEGVYAKMVEDAVRMQAGHITVEHVEYRDAPAIDLVVKGVEKLRGNIRELSGVERTKALVMGQGVAKSGGGAVGVAVMGVEPEVEAISSPLAHKLISGEYLADGDTRQVVVGSELAERLKLGSKKDAKKITQMLQPLFAAWGKVPESVFDEARTRLSVGKKLVVSSNDVNGQLVEELVRVKGVFRTGAIEIDGFFIQLPIEFSRKLYGMGEHSCTQLGVIVENADERDEILEQVAGLIDEPETAVRPWEEILPDLATYIAVDGGSNLIFQGIFIFLILFIIFNTILMSVLERRREWAVLLALGTPLARLKRQILAESAFIGLIGCFFGLLIGGVLSYLGQEYGIDISAFYEEGISVSGVALDTVVRADLTAKLLIVMGLIVFGATLLISLYPMSQIKRIHVGNILRG